MRAGGQYAWNTQRHAGVNSWKANLEGAKVEGALLGKTKLGKRVRRAFLQQVRTLSA